MSEQTEGLCPECAVEVAELIQENQRLSEEVQRLEMEYARACMILDEVRAAEGEMIR